jgi:hypothetical protein
MRNITAKQLTQPETVLNHLHSKGSISGLEAMALYRITSLTKVMSVLQDRGTEIRPEWRTDNTGKRYTRYYLPAFELAATA